MSILSNSKCEFYKAWDVIIYIFFRYYLDIIFTYMLAAAAADADPAAATVSR